jgi:two-component system cell cycle sensor histidine kinase/response regulator CckA
LCALSRPELVANARSIEIAEKPECLDLCNYLNTLVRVPFGKFNRGERSVLDQRPTRNWFAPLKRLKKRRRLGELQREEAQLRSIFESAAFGIVLADAEGQTHECNPALERMLGYTKDELRTMRISDLTHPDDTEETERALHALIEGELEHVHTERRYIHKDGSIVWVRVIASTVPDPNGELALSIAMIEDISARKSAEADTDLANIGRESAEADTDVARDYAADLIETAGAMIVGLDLNGGIQLFNKAAEEISGYTREELAGRNWFEVVVPEERYPAAREEFERLLAGGLPQEFENPILTKSGEERYIVWRRTDLNDHGVTVGMVSIGIDVTELERAEEALRHERDFVAKIIDTSPIGIVAHNDQGEITFANSEAERVLGLTRDEARHRYNAPDWCITDYEGRPFPDEELPFRRVKATGQPVYDVRYAIENASGERVYLSINGAPALGENGEWDGMIASIDDISKLTRAEATRGLLEVELLQSQKMEAVGKLATGVAHNFNNLLTAITGYSELLLARLPADSDLRPDVEEIGRAGGRAAEVAHGLLRFSRRGREHRERLDLNSVITEMETLLRQVIRSDIEIATVLADDLDRVTNNHSLIEQVIVNLILNSSDAMPDGGKLTIETANLRLAEPRVVRDLSLPAGNFVTLAVRDNGIGMDEETRARVFEPFYSTKDPECGTGLGLSTVFGIIEESEGGILVESAPGRGSTFTVFLPSIPDQRSRP